MIFAGGRIAIVTNARAGDADALSLTVGQHDVTSVGYPRLVRGNTILNSVNCPGSVSTSLFAGALARMQQHVLDDGIGALAVLHDFFEVVLQHLGEFVDFLPKPVGQGSGFEQVIQFVGAECRPGCALLAPHLKPNRLE
jgi:hypothetical protein